jgi:hypothetical protein
LHKNQSKETKCDVQLTKQHQETLEESHHGVGEPLVFLSSMSQEAARESHPAVDDGLNSEKNCKKV